MIIDFHVHCFPDELAEKATSSLAERSGAHLWLNGTVGEIKASMKNAGISSSVVLSIATRPQQSEKITQWSASIQDEEIIAFGSIHPDLHDWLRELEKMKSMGIKGIKMHPDYQNFFVDEERMFPIYEKVFEFGLIIVFHAGIDIGLPAPYHCTPERLKKVVRSFSGGKIVAAHMGGYGCWDDVEKHLVGENLYMDTSFSIDKMDEMQFKRLIRNHGYDKLLFATDSPWSGQKEEVDRIKNLNLPQNIEDAIFGGNAIRILEGLKW